MLGEVVREHGGDRIVIHLTRLNDPRVPLPPEPILAWPQEQLAQLQTRLPCAR